MTWLDMLWQNRFQLSVSISNLKDMRSLLNDNSFEAIITLDSQKIYSGPQYLYSSNILPSALQAM